MRPSPLVAFGLTLLGLSTLSLTAPGPSGAGSPAFEVDSTLDEPDANLGDGVCSSTPSGRCTLRAAVDEGQLAGIPVEVDEGTFTLTLGHLWVRPSGWLSLTGEGSKHTTIDGQYQWRVLDISNGGRAVVSGVTLTGGAGGRSDAYPGHDHGGAIHNHGFLHLAQAAVQANSSGLAAQQKSGAGLTNAGTGTAELRNVTFSENFIFLNGGRGGAIENLGTLQAYHVTIVNNAATEGGGLYLAGSSTAFLDGALMAINSGYSCAGTVTQGTTIADSSSLDDDGSCTFNGAGSHSAVDPKLGTFDEKHKVWTLQPDSPAIDAVAAKFVPIDQTGRTRPQDGNGDGAAFGDIGAWEAKARKR